MKRKIILKGPIRIAATGQAGGEEVTVTLANVFGLSFDIDHHQMIDGGRYHMPVYARNAEFKLEGIIHEADKQLFEMQIGPKPTSSIVDQIERVLQHDPATIIYWKDGTKTVVKADGEPFDEEKGMAMAIAKKVLGNEGNYYETFKKYIKKDV